MNSYLESDFQLLKSADAQLFEAFEKEQLRQSRNIELIASENIVTYADLPARFIEGKGIPSKIKTWEYFKVE